MQLRENGLKVEIDTITGNCLLRYNYPIRQDDIDWFTELCQTLSLTIQHHKGKTFIIYQCSGTSTFCMTSFRAVQKQLMIHTRVARLNRTIGELNRLVN